MTSMGSTMYSSSGVAGRYALGYSPSGLVASERVCLGTTCTPTSGGRVISRTYDMDGVLASVGDGLVGTTSSWSPVIGAGRWGDESLVSGNRIASERLASWQGEFTYSHYTRNTSIELYEESICARDALGRVTRRAERILSSTYRWYGTRRPLRVLKRDRRDGDFEPIWAATSIRPAPLLWALAWVVATAAWLTVLLPDTSTGSEKTMLAVALAAAFGLTCCAVEEGRNAAWLARFIQPEAGRLASLGSARTCLSGTVRDVGAPVARTDTRAVHLSRARMTCDEGWVPVSDGLRVQHSVVMRGVFVERRAEAFRIREVRIACRRGIWVVERRGRFARLLVTTSHTTEDEAIRQLAYEVA